MSQQPEGRPGRYQRSFAGLIGALLVTLLVVAGYVVFRAVVRENPATEATPVDYLSAVEGAQGGGGTVVYPPSLPTGWVATSVEYDPTDPPAWSLGVLTDESRFVGLRQQDADLDDLLTTYVDPEPDRGADVTIDSPLADTWQSWSDRGGDHAYAAEVPGLGWVLVYGSADPDVLREYAATLTTTPR